MELIRFAQERGFGELAAVGYLWTFAALRLSTGATAHYDRRRVAGDRHTAAQRHTFNRFLGCLCYCLQTGHLFIPTAPAIGANTHRTLCGPPAPSLAKGQYVSVD